MSCCGVPTAWRAPTSPAACSCRPRPCRGFGAGFSTTAARGPPRGPRGGGPHTGRRGGRTDPAVPAATVERVVELAMSPPPAGRSRWTTRLLAKEVGLTSGCVSDLLRRNGLKPHRVRTYKVSRDPHFVAKVRDIVGLYLHPPEHAVVLSMDEKTSIQALE